ncbi:MAG: arsenite methyltransferase [Cyclobacteriaceae bacterium]
MDTSEQIKQIVKEKYGEIADQSREQNAVSCCGSGCGCNTLDEAIMAEDYSALKGYVADADLGLGCGLPTEFAHIKEGDVVVDLGSGAGNDAFVARSVTGPLGKVIGVDFTAKMVDKARANAEKMGFNNVEFLYGDIEKMPLNESVADVVVSNCVLNLVPNKAKAFAETFRILKPGGHFSVSDIVLKGALPESLKTSLEMYTGCVSGAIQQDDYLRVVKEAGFIEIKVQKVKKITIPDEILSVYLNTGEKEKYSSGELGIHSITLYAEKPSAEEKNETCCAPGCCSN